MAYRYTTEERIFGGSYEERLNPHFGKTKPGVGDLGAARLPNPMVKNTELQAVPEQDARRRSRTGLSDRFRK
jgi:hypothetical protein